MTLLHEGHLRLCNNKKWRTVYVMVRRLEESCTTSTPRLDVVYYKKAGDFSPLGSFVVDSSCKIEVLEPPHSKVVKGLPNQTVIRIHSDDASKSGVVMLTNTLTSSTGSDVTLGTITSNGGVRWHETDAITMEKTSSFLQKLAVLFTQYVAGKPAAEVTAAPSNLIQINDSIGVACTPSAMQSRGSKPIDFEVPDLLMKGWMYKQGGFRKNYIRRWFELSTISFSYADGELGKFLGDVSVTKDTPIEWHVEVQKKEIRYFMTITTEPRVWHLYVTEQAELDRWLDALRLFGCTSVSERESGANAMGGDNAGSSRDNAGSTSHCVGRMRSNSLGSRLRPLSALITRADSGTSNLTVYLALSVLAVHERMVICRARSFDNTYRCMYTDSISFGELKPGFLQ
eukprot:m.1269734 g.1269734  ORF g.1269734 m.1269734 type:complete len:399 (-) comp24748_c0_seq3:5189-6385(-)